MNESRIYESRGKIAQENADAIVNKITGKTDLNLAANCDIVVEAEVENMNYERIGVHTRKKKHKRCVIKWQRKVLEIMIF